MHLSELPAGSRVFVDANIMVYFFLQVEPFAEICEVEPFLFWYHRLEKGRGSHF